MTDASPSPDKFHCQRSRLLDAFASIEGAVVRLLGRSGCVCGGETLGQKIEKLKKAKAAPLYSKAAKSEAEQLLVQLEPLLPLRADIVHSPLKLVTIDGEVRACFVNTRQACDLAPSARIVSADGVEKIIQTVSRLAGKLAAI